ncbi:MAG: endolytic transglycosylase MltG [Treponema sp.]|nr:endolytic transglycosylase MltG [Treponema sp.]
MRINIVKLIIIIDVFVVVFALIVGTAVIIVAMELNKAPASAQGEAFFEVEQGETSRSIGRRLEEAGVIKSRHFWYVVNRIDKDVIKAGAYTIRLPATQFEIHNILETGRQPLIKVTVPEGATLAKTARLFDETGVCTEEAFMEAALNPEILEAFHIPAKTFEGYLFPDTYLFQEDYNAKRVVRIMAETFFKRLSSIVDVASLTPEELFEKVTLASIVEREYRLAEEAPLMAGVFYNRLAVGMALQSCATVEYIITEIQHKPHPEIISTTDTEIENPYNTYRVEGLPPGPISAPGLTALSAAFNPVTSDHLFFRLVDPNVGKHYFSKTFDEHIKAGKLYVKGK